MVRHTLADFNPVEVRRLRSECTYAELALAWAHYCTTQRGTGYYILED